MNRIRCMYVCMYTTTTAATITKNLEDDESLSRSK